MRDDNRSLAVALVAVVATAVLVLGPMPVAEAQGSGSSPSTEGGYLLFSGGYVKGNVVRTSTTLQRFSQSASWNDLSGATVRWTVPFLDFDVFAVTFSARCQLYNASGPDVVRIRVLDNGVPMEPDDGDQVFCSYPRPVTYTGNWVKRALAGDHTIKVQIRAVDLPPFSGNVAVLIDDYTLELVVHH